MTNRDVHQQVIQAINTHRGQALRQTTASRSLRLTLRQILVRRQKQFRRRHQLQAIQIAIIPGDRARHSAHHILTQLDGLIAVSRQLLVRRVNVKHARETRLPQAPAPHATNLTNGTLIARRRHALENKELTRLADRRDRRTHGSRVIVHRRSAAVKQCPGVGEARGGSGRQRSARVHGRNRRDTAESAHGTRIHPLVFRALPQPKARHPKLPLQATTMNKERYYLKQRIPRPR